MFLSVVLKRKSTKTNHFSLMQNTHFIPKIPLKNEIGRSWGGGDHIYIYIIYISTQHVFWSFILLFAKICLHNEPELALALVFGENLSKFKQPVKMVKLTLKSYQSEYNFGKRNQDSTWIQGKLHGSEKTTTGNHQPPKNYGPYHPCMVCLPTFTINIYHSCR